MSFSSKVKTELCRENPVQKKCCARAECYGVLLYCNTFSHREIRIITGSDSFAQRLPRLFKKAFGCSIEEQGEGSKHSFVMTDRAVIRQIFESYGYTPDSALQHHINLAVLEDDCCRAAFVRGAFLAGGSIMDPAKRYHLELVTDHATVSREAYSVLLEMGFAPKDISRNGHQVIYFKNSEAIEDLLTTIGAPVSAMEIMQAKVEKNMRNAVNRRVNCDSANADKVVSAAQAQLEAIRRIDRASGLGELPPRLQETALLRIANPEASLADLALLADPPVTKSCLSHRLRKLTEIAAALPREI
ncbi:MAG TPA: DNA-binding protein WhiA [Firmicutes bacterium]|nr:DNA-binding protein WhiA [Bacillota bacterium]